MQNTQNDIWKRKEKITYTYKGEEPKELLTNITKLSKETNCYNNSDFVMPPVGIIYVPKEFHKSWIHSVVIFSGWKVELES